MGTGNPWFEGDVATQNGRIAAIGRLGAARAQRVLDATGKIVAPGFIDVHTHIEGGIDRLPTADNFVHMGVTSVITGNCGSSALPLRDWFAKLTSGGVSINIGSLAGHNSIRRTAMQGSFDREPNPEEQQRMRDLTLEAMYDGAFGLSTGLEYVPGAYAKTAEIADLAKVAADLGGLYATHLRNEDIRVEDSIRESLEIGRLAGCPVQISHFKISSRSRWGASSITTRLVEESRQRGQQVAVDQYLYTAGSTGVEILFPSWVFEGGARKAEERLRDPVQRARIRNEVVRKAQSLGFKDLSFASVAGYKANPEFNGKNLSQITRTVRRKAGIQEEAEQAIEILLGGGASMVLHKMSDDDVDRIFKQEYTMVGSDAGVITMGGADVPHPRGFGNNARVLNIYVRGRKVVGLEAAIRKMTTLPAQTFKLWDRGLLRPGMAADIVVFDAGTVADQATFQKPKQSPVGFEYVLVNGEIVLDHGEHTGIKPGRILRGPGAR